MALAELLAGLERDAEAEIAMLRERGRDEAAAVVAAAHDGVARRRESAVATERSALAAEEAFAAAAALGALRGEELAAGAALMARAAAAADAAVGKREREMDAAMLRRLLLAGQRFLPPGAMVFRCPAELAGAAREAAAGTAIAVELVSDRQGEPPAALLGGGWEVDLSLRSLLRRRWAELAPRLLRTLEERGATSAGSGG